MHSWTISRSLCIDTGYTKYTVRKYICRYLLSSWKIKSLIYHLFCQQKMHFHDNGKFSQINSIFFKAEKEDSFYMGGGTSDFETFQSAKVLILIFHNSTIIWSLLISGKLEIDCFLRFDFWIDCLSQEIFSIFSSHCDLVWVYLIHHTRESIDCLAEGIGYIMDENNVSEFTYTILCKNLLCLITLIKLKNGEWINQWQHQVLKVLIEQKNKFRDFLKCWTSKSCDWTSGSVLEVTSVHKWHMDICYTSLTSMFLAGVPSCSRQHGVESCSLCFCSSERIHL